MILNLEELEPMSCEENGNRITKVETKLTTVESDIKEIKDNIKKIMDCLLGNGKPGLSEQCRNISEWRKMHDERHRQSHKYFWIFAAAITGVILPPIIRALAQIIGD